MPQTVKSNKKILEAAAALFYKNGYKATGVEAIAQASGVTKATLYHHFSNKDALIEETLKYLSSYYKDQYVKSWSKPGLKPQSQLTVLFDEMSDFFKETECYGCPFINAAGEYTERDHPVRQICEAHYAFIIDHLEEFARAAKLKSPRILAEKIATIIAGSYGTWYVGGIMQSAKHGKELARLVISSHELPHSQS